MATGQRATGWPQQPVVCEINTWVWLDELSREHGRRIDLGGVPASAWDTAILPGVDAVWLMGVWTRSPAGSVIARSDPGVRAELVAALPDLTDDDVVGSPYSVRGYTVDARLGGNDGLAAARAVLAERGVKLIVDYVPNHVARDHAWVTSHPEYLVHAGAEAARARPDDFVAVGNHVVALGRDPHFPPWTDVVQLNAFSKELRAATAATLAGIARMADGVRCDMAMLLLNDVFAATWGELAGPVPATDFWAPVIRSVREAAPSLLFIAEAYWDREAALLEQGFDYCYDKRLYDCLVAADAAGLRAHLEIDVRQQLRMMRFLENHDEPRSTTVLSASALRTAAVAVTTLPGGLLLYEGQAEGRSTRPPGQLARRPAEPVDQDLRDFYLGLLNTLQDRGMREGTWALRPIDSVPGGAPAVGLVAWSWEAPSGRHLVVVNLAATRCDGRVRLPWSDLGPGTAVVREMLGPQRYEHDAFDVAEFGLYVSLGPEAFHLLAVGG